MFTLKAIPDLSGTWTLQSKLVARQGHGLKPAVLNGTHVITIMQTPTELRIEGPRGLFEGTPPIDTYRLDGSKGSYVQDFGGWWRKSQTQLRMDDTDLAMRLRVIGGW